MAGTAIWALRWQDVDPVRHDFDSSRVRAAIEQALDERERSKRSERDPGQATEDAVDRALLAALGPWVAGWRWAASEPGGGGPVRAYCCARDSLKGTRAEQAGTIARAVADWRARVEDLARLFVELASEPRALEDAAPHAASRLLPLVLEWTGAEDAWYRTFHCLLVWSLQAQGVAPLEAEALVAKAISGRFESWVAPDDEARDSALAALRAAAREPLPAGEDDATAQWLATRGNVRWDQDRYYHPGPVRVDGHERFIDEVDARRDPVRAHRMRQALARARKEAARGESLDFARLAAWQRVVLGEAAPFRDRDAFAHEGRDRYAYADGLRERFDACLREATAPGLSVIARAARVYLDVCYVHPFADGNARAARLALDFVLSREGLGLHVAGPVFLVARRTMRSGEVFRFQWVLDYLVGQRARG